MQEELPKYRQDLPQSQEARQEERLDGEMEIIVEYGLKNKREVWHAQYALAKIRTAERHLLTLDENGRAVSSKVMRCSAA